VGETIDLGKDFISGDLRATQLVLDAAVELISDNRLRSMRYSAMNLRCFSVSLLGWSSTMQYFFP
jgi:hypothetical protein